MCGDELDMRFISGLNAGIGAEYIGLHLETNFNFGVLSLADFDNDSYTSDLSVTLG